MRKAGKVLTDPAICMSIFLFILLFFHKFPGLYKQATIRNPAKFLRDCLRQRLNSSAIGFVHQNIFVDFEKTTQIFLLIVFSFLEVAIDHIYDLNTSKLFCSISHSKQFSVTQLILTGSTTQNRTHDVFSGTDRIIH